MRLPIVQFPNIVVNNLSHFAPVFTTEEQKKHFCEYVTGLIVGDKATITTINAVFLNKNDQSSLNKFISQASWDEEALNRRRIQLELSRLHQRPISDQAVSHWFPSLLGIYQSRADEELTAAAYPPGCFL